MAMEFIGIRELYFFLLSLFVEVEKQKQGSAIYIPNITISETNRNPCFSLFLRAVSLSVDVMSSLISDLFPLCKNCGAHLILLNMRLVKEITPCCSAPQTPSSTQTCQSHHTFP
jgi:hypothetical protein